MGHITNYMWVVWFLITHFLTVNTRYIEPLHFVSSPKISPQKDILCFNRNIVLKNAELKNTSSILFTDSYEYHKPVMLKEVIQFLGRNETSEVNTCKDKISEKDNSKDNLDQLDQKSDVKPFRKCLKRNDIAINEVDKTDETKNVANTKEEQTECFIDATLGGGGHTLEILKKIKNSKIVAIDKDIEALYYTKQKLHTYVKSNQLIMIHGDFRNVLHLLNKNSLPLKNYSGMLIDLGVSLHQLKSYNRGFSYKYDGILNMNMDQYNEDDMQHSFMKYKNVKHNAESSDAKESKHQYTKIHYVLNTFSAKKLQFIMESLGEEKKARKIAKKIVYWRKHNGTITTTMDLKNIVLLTCKNNYKANNKVLSRVFQAFRIYVNDELNALKELLLAAHKLLKPLGRLITISYHSLEDKCVTQTVLNKKDLWTQINKEVITPTAEEIKKNNSSRSAKMRVFEKKKISTSRNL